MTNRQERRAMTETSKIVINNNLARAAKLLLPTVKGFIVSSFASFARLARFAPARTPRWCDTVSGRGRARTVFDGHPRACDTRPPLNFFTREIAESEQKKRRLSGSARHKQICLYYCCGYKGMALLGAPCLSSFNAPVASAWQPALR